MTEPASARPAPALGTMAVFVLCGLVPMLVVAATSSRGYSAWVVALLVMILAGARFAWILSSRQRRLFEMVTWLFVYVFLGLAPMVQLREAVDPGTTPNIVHEFDWRAGWIVLAGCLALIVGSFVGKHKQPPSAGGSGRLVSRTRTNILSFAANAAGIYYIARVGPAHFFGTRDSLAAARATVWPDSGTAALVTGFVTMSLLVAVVAQLHVRKTRKANGKKLPFAMLGMSVVILFVTVNPISSPRYVFGTVALGVLAALGMYGSLRKFRVVAAGALFALVFLFPLADAFRASLDTSLAFENPLDSLLSGDFDSFAQINNSALYVQQFGPTMGYQALGVLLFWVPRFLWPDKPVDTGILLANSREYGFSNLSAPLWSEMFINGGWALLIAGMFVFGFALRRWDMHTERQLSLSGVPSVLGCIVPFYLLIILRGSLLQAAASLTVIMLLAWYVSRPVRHPDGLATEKNAPGSLAFATAA